MSSRSFLSRFLAVAASAIAFVPAGSILSFSGCAQSFVAVRDELHPAGGSYLVTATIEEWPRGYYSVAVTIRNVSSQPLALSPSMFRLEGIAPTSFVPAGHMPMFMGLNGYRMPEAVAPKSSAQGEVFFGIRGTEVPSGPVRFVAELPDGEHAFVFDLIQ